MKKGAKILSILLASATIITATPGIAKAKDIEVNPPTTYVKLPGSDGSEDIVSQDTRVVYVKKQASFNFITNVIAGAIIAEGVAKFNKSTNSPAGNSIVSSIVTGALSAFSASTTYEEKIVLNRYYVRGADGRVRFKVYASYYNNATGQWLNSRLVQEG